MGTLRLLLAIGVLLHHLRGCKYAMTGGATSVQTFFIISGFLIAMILDVKYNKPGQLWLFYSNRALRIYSTYWAILVVVASAQIAAYFVAHEGTFDLWRQNAAGLGHVGFLYLAVTNIVIVGQDLALFMTIGHHGLQWSATFWNSSPILPAFMMIPPAWSLSLELSFYALAPWILRRKTRWILALFACSVLVRIVLWIEGFRADPWSYRFFPNELSLFLAGALAYRLLYRREWVCNHSLKTKLFQIGVFPAVVLYPLYDHSHGMFFSATKLLYLAYIVTALPLLFSTTHAFSFDRRLGELSYPLYLCHFSIVQLLNHFAARLNIWFRASIAILLSCSAAFAFVLVLERPLDRFRQSRLKRSVAELGRETSNSSDAAKPDHIPPLKSGDMFGEEVVPKPARGDELA